ncbi:hypothetical protein [Caldicoprobacter faecalis]|uniref:Uncharacterized protein n=1 Tax=Caldicoprobacter faecalis TaxID=937334 RepID=A0A1I5RIK0_9FIRM|nr:hypothetical protein [Caldicoprobacter faecalis]PZN08247.1 MAG: hypothetical protein DIU64_10845 [Caldicoprobacter oshimai]SFP58342.1 hypothetical protein SAMN05444406_1012 [Caldicoprobacter faecalis]
MNYNDRLWIPDCRYPIEYHHRYGYMVPWMEPEVYDGMVYPVMYPEIYYKIYPYVCRICDEMDDPYVLYPSQTQVEDMINRCYDLCVKEMPELEEYAGVKMQEKLDAENLQFERRRMPILRDLIAIILLSELFRRRRRFFPRRSGWHDGYGYY